MIVIMHLINRVCEIRSGEGTKNKYHDSCKTVRVENIASVPWDKMCLEFLLNSDSSVSHDTDSMGKPGRDLCRSKVYLCSCKVDVGCPKKALQWLTVAAGY